MDGKMKMSSMVIGTAGFNVILEKCSSGAILKKLSWLSLYSTSYSTPSIIGTLIIQRERCASLPLQPFLCSRITGNVMEDKSQICSAVFYDIKVCLIEPYIKALVTYNSL